MKKIGLFCVTVLAGLSLAGCNNLASQSHKTTSSSSSIKVVKYHKDHKKSNKTSHKDKQSSSSSSSQSTSNSNATNQQGNNSGQQATAQSNNSSQQQAQSGSQGNGRINNADQALAAARAKYGDGNGNYHWTIMYDANTGQPARNADGSYFVKAIDPTQGTMTGTAQSVNVYPDGSMTNN
ncbi:hypothetical protein [Limosilactobacillus fermentum]|uniref:hypothetical protein n=1 Tax=Limosilactobacillus fermentum TaxID=1613 RepID=UPI0013C53E51|nr:hypothetical protein [Limosilactobacillus fermentum]QID92624.1 hypothetical protein GJA14_01475 [Limosilactobacillus fermentum]UTF47816.1 hypothetical protein NHN16_01410 [Limosilactobacillus fermentum]